MSLSPGARVGHYEILASLGAGGMGEIHRARDMRLGREVAIKGLTGAFSNDPQRLARFDREAKLLASLNHGNIGAIYGLSKLTLIWPREAPMMPATVHEVFHEVRIESGMPLPGSSSPGGSSS